MYNVPVRPHFWPQPSGDLILTFITCDLCACSLSISVLYFMWLSSLCRWYLCAYPLFAVCGSSCMPLVINNPPTALLYLSCTLPCENPARIQVRLFQTRVQVTLADNLGILGSSAPLESGIAALPGGVG